MAWDEYWSIVRAIFFDVKHIYLALVLCEMEKIRLRRRAQQQDGPQLNRFVFSWWMGAGECSMQRKPYWKIVFVLYLITKTETASKFGDLCCRNNTFALKYSIMKAANISHNSQLNDERRVKYIIRTGIS